MTQHSYPIYSHKNHEIHRAGFIIIDPFTIVENGYIECENGLIKGVFQGVPKQEHIDHGPGALIPCLVNAHLHLELSALNGMVPFAQGFKSWVQTLLTKRAALTQAQLVQAARISAENLLKLGNKTIGDISTLGLGQTILKDIKINGVCFHEYLGESQDSFDIEKGSPLSCSLAGHAPHTSSPQLLKTLKEKTRLHGLPFSIHVAESDDETIFIRDKKGDWADFLTSRGINFASWDIGSKTPVSYINDLGLLGPSTMAIHLINVSSSDLGIIADTQTKVVLCPRSNFNLHKKLPDIDAILNHGIPAALGTDSLASCDSLDILDEMRFTAHHYPLLNAADIFSMGTVNGAKSLGLDKVTGTLDKGKKADFIYMMIDSANKNSILERIITND